GRGSKAGFVRARRVKPGSNSRLTPLPPLTSDTLRTPGAVGVGVGPFNLSLAALLAPTGFDARFFERSANFQWHPGLLLPEATLQVSYLKDLVTLVDPTSQYSFVAFLRAHK